MLLGLAAALPTSASAASNTAQLELHGIIPPKCLFTTVPGSSDLGELTTGKVVDIGDLAFTCNLATSGNVTLTVRSENGGLKRDGGTETIAYQAAWNIQGKSDNYGDAAAVLTPATFSLSSGSSGAAQSGMYRVKITGPTDTIVAGTYRDLITYTISP